MTLEDLRAFVTVASERSFSRAARKLRRTQPAISQAIKRLEEELEEKRRQEEEERERKRKEEEELWLKKKRQSCFMSDRWLRREKSSSSGQIQAAGRGGRGGQTRTKGMMLIGREKQRDAGWRDRWETRATEADLRRLIRCQAVARGMIARKRTFLCKENRSYRV